MSNDQLSNIQGAREWAWREGRRPIEVLVSLEPPGRKPQAGVYSMAAEEGFDADFRL